MDRLSPLIRRYLTDEPYRRLSDAELWNRLRGERDEAAFRVFLERVGGRIYQRCRVVLADDGLAEDAFQNTLIEFLRRRADLPSYPAAVAWLYETATNKARSARRNWWRLVLRERRKAATVPTKFETDSGASLSQRETGDAVGVAVAALPTRERRAIELVFFEEMTHTDAAAALGWTRGAVGVYVHRGLERLRKVLGPAGLAVGGLTVAESPVMADDRLGRVMEAAWRTAAEASPAFGWFTGPRVWAIGLLFGATAATGVAFALAPSGSAPVPPPRVDESTVVETLQEANRRHFEADVRRPLQAALNGLLAGDGGEAVITDVSTRGTIVQVTAELRHGKPQAHTSRLELIYDTHRRVRLFNVDAWGTGIYESANPRDPLMLARNRVGAPDRTRPTTGLKAVLAAMERMPKDQRGAAEEAAERDPILSVLSAHTGRWLIRGNPRLPAKVVDAKAWWCPLQFVVPGRGKFYPPVFDYRWGQDGRVTATCGDLGGIVFSTDGTRIDFPRTGEWWERPAGRTASHRP